MFEKFIKIVEIKTNKYKRKNLPVNCKKIKHKRESRIRNVMILYAICNLQTLKQKSMPLTNN
jgi:hypothetical protein